MKLIRKLIHTDSNPKRCLQGYIFSKEMHIPPLPVLDQIPQNKISFHSEINPYRYLINYFKIVIHPYSVHTSSGFLIMWRFSGFWPGLNGHAEFQRVCPTEAVPTQARGRVGSNLQRWQRYPRIRFQGKQYFGLWYCIPKRLSVTTLSVCQPVFKFWMNSWRVLNDIFGFDSKASNFFSFDLMLF